MNYCIAACDQFESIKDPNNSGHVCYRSKYEIGRIELRRIMDDPTFVFIKDNIVYFKKIMDQQRIKEWLENKVNTSSDEELQGISNLIVIAVIILLLWLVC